MKQKTKNIILTCAIGLPLLGGALLYSAIDEGIVSTQYKVAGERVLVNENPPIHERFGGVVEEEVFMPKVKLEKWGDETYIEIWRDEEPNGKAKKEGKKTKWTTKDGKREYHLYPLTEEEDGISGFEYEIILHEKPKSNVITTHIESKGLEFYYQPPLNEESHPEADYCTETDCYKDEEVIIHRPENIVGSYAVYHESKSGDYTALGGKNYMAGKAFQIPRPKVIDANGWEVWEELHIENGIQTITIPQEFLDNAKYPIRHAIGETFGFTGTGGTTYTSNNDAGHFGSYFMGVAGTMVDMRVYCWQSGAGNVWRLGIYKHSDASKVDESDTFGAAPFGNWSTKTANGTAEITAQNYWIVVGHDSQSAASGRYDAGGTDQGTASSNHSSTLPATLTPTLEDYKFSIYATYTPSGGAAAPVNPPIINIWEE